MSLTSIHGIVELTLVRGAEHEGDRLDLVIEIPHGATATSDFTALAALMRSPLPEGLVDFFHVNTDTGAPELALALAERLVHRFPGRAVAIVRCRIPRTLIDTNRVLDKTLAEYKAGGVAPGLMPWVTDPADVALLRERYEAYHGAVRQAVGGLGDDGAMVLLHSYAPRTVGIEVDLQIVPNLHRAYEPELYETWPTRPEMDVIGRDPDGVLHAPAAVVEALAAELAALGMALGDSHTYPLHPSTMGWVHAMRLPGRTLCLEVRRDLFVERFVPFSEAAIDPARVAALAEPITRALAHLW